MRPEAPLFPSEHFGKDPDTHCLAGRKRGALSRQKVRRRGETSGHHSTHWRGLGGHGHQPEIKCPPLKQNTTQHKPYTFWPKKMKSI